MWKKGFDEVEKVQETIDIAQACYYNNRELSWLNFNLRVLEEAADERNAFLERYKFLAIFSSNLDEFFMVRVAGLLDQVQAGYNRPENKAGLTPLEQIDAISVETHKQIHQQDTIYHEQLFPRLRQEGVHLLSIPEITTEQMNYLEQQFDEHIFPVLTPMVIDAYRPFPALLNKSLNLAITIAGQREDDKCIVTNNKLALVQVPSVLDRFIQLPETTQQTSFILLEQVISHFIYKLFKGFEVTSVTQFRITRNADLMIHEDEAEDLLVEIEEELKKRQRGAAVRLEVQNDHYHEGVVEYLIHELAIEEKQVYYISAPLDLTCLFDLYKALKTTHSQLLDPTFIPQPSQDLQGQKDVFKAILQEDVLLHHPYESFEPVVQFIAQAADDPDVLAIKQTLYRVSGNSPIIQSLKRAAENGKQVTVLLELKARFDEKNNVQWAKHLEKAGCHVIYGISFLKTHSKITLVVRRRKNTIERFVHLSTGNYNDATARTYTDLGLLTADEQIGIDATNFFNYLSGYMEKPTYHQLIVSPFDIRDEFIKLIQEEIHNHQQFGNGKIILKMNSLSDKQLIMKLYEASQAGVTIHLIIRGICCLRPGIPGVSDTITVRSIVGRFLEHTRIYYFHANGEKKSFLSSADMMTRNMENRVEILFPINKPHLKQRIARWLELFLADNVKAREQQADGSYQYAKKPDGSIPINSQQFLCQVAEQTTLEQHHLPTARSKKKTNFFQNAFSPLLKKGKKK